MRRMRLLLLVAPLVASCSKCNSNRGESPAAAPSASSSGDAAITARCTTLGQPIVFGALAGDDAGDGPVAFGAEASGVAADAKAFVVGVRSAGIGGEAQVIEIPSNGGPYKSIAKLPIGARAPLVAIGKDGTRQYSTMWVDEKVRRLNVTVGEKVFAMSQSKDESEATALLPNLVAWDDFEEKAGIGNIRVRVLGQPERDEEIVSPKESDAAWPAFAPSKAADRSVLLWLSEKPEQESDGGGEPSQAAAYRWLEGAVIDTATGKRVGPVRALTSMEGHAQTFAAIWGDAGLIVVVRDDPRPTDGDGGELVALRSPIDAGGAIGEPARVSIADKDVAPGVAALLPRPGGALVSWLGQDGTAHLTPAFAIGGASVEPALHDRRVIGTYEDRALASRIVGSGLELTVLRCAP